MADFSQREKSIFLQLFPKLPENKLTSIPLVTEPNSNEKWVYYFKRRVYTIHGESPSSFPKTNGIIKRWEKGTLYSIVQVLPASVKKDIKDFIKNHFKKTNIHEKKLVDNLERFKKDKEYRKKALNKILTSSFEFKKPIPPEYFFIALTLLKVKKHNLFPEDSSEDAAKKGTHALVKDFYKSEDEFLKKYWEQLQTIEEINYLSEVCHKHGHFCLEDNLRFHSKKKGELLKHGERVFDLFLSKNSQGKTTSTTNGRSNTQSQKSNQKKNKKLKDDSEPASQTDTHNAKVLSRKEIEKRERRKPELITNKGVRRYKTDPEISKFVLDDVDYECQYDNDHKTFTSGKGYSFTEAHHLIPMSKQGEKNLKPKRIDISANIVSLCPNCHRAVHLGNKKEKEERLKKLYKIKEEALKEAKLCNSFKKLLTYYKTNKKPRASRSTT